MRIAFIMFCVALLMPSVAAAQSHPGDKRVLSSGYQLVPMTHKGEYEIGEKVSSQEIAAKAIQVEPPPATLEPMSVRGHERTRVEPYYNSDVPLDDIEECVDYLDNSSQPTNVDSRYTFCGSQDWVYALRKDDGEIVGSVYFKEWTYGASPAGERATELWSTYRDFYVDPDGLPVDLASLTIENRIVAGGYSGVDGSNPACDVEQANVSATAADWAAGHVSTARLSQGEAEAHNPHAGVEEKISRCWFKGFHGAAAAGEELSWTDPVRTTLIQSGVRIDSAPAPYTSGNLTRRAVYDWGVPIMDDVFSLTSPTIPEVSKHVNDALNHPDQTIPAKENKHMPGLYPRGTKPENTLSRVYAGADAESKKRYDANRSKVRSTCDAQPGWSPRPEGKECDEYPFASTWEGAGSGGDFSVRLLDKVDNGAAGNKLNAWYLDNRILDGDRFWIKVTP